MERLRRHPAGAARAAPRWLAPEPAADRGHQRWPLHHQPAARRQHRARPVGVTPSRAVEQRHPARDSSEFDALTQRRPRRPEPLPAARNEPHRHREGTPVVLPGPSLFRSGRDQHTAHCRSARPARWPLPTHRWHPLSGSCWGRPACHVGRRGRWRPRRRRAHGPFDCDVLVIGGGPTGPCPEPPGQPRRPRDGARARREVYPPRHPHRRGDAAELPGHRRDARARGPLPPLWPLLRWSTTTAPRCSPRRWSTRGAARLPAPASSTRRLLNGCALRAARASAHARRRRRGGRARRRRCAGVTVRVRALDGGAARHFPRALGGGL